MLELLNNIPINIWSVALGSVIAFGGVLISNRSQSKRLESQLSHDTELKVIERKAAMRREVYLNAAEELVRATVLQVPVMVGIRKELDIGTCMKSYKDMISSNAKRIREQLDNFLASLDGKA